MLFQLAAAPAVMLAVFIFIKDRYEKEPDYMLFTVILFGFVSASYVLALDIFLENIFDTDSMLFSAFVVSAGTEEFVKLVFLFFLMLRNPNLNEPFDAIFYSAYVSLGYAWAENIIYVYSPELGGLDTALMRAVFSVPGHFLFAVAMGYSFAKYGYYKKGKIYLLEAFIAAYIIHGLYNIIIMAAGKYYLLLFLPYLLVLWRISLKKIYILSIKSPFKNK